MSGFVVPIRGTREFGLSRTGISWLLAMAQAIDLTLLIPVGGSPTAWATASSWAASASCSASARSAWGSGSFPWFALGCACFGLGLAGWMLPLGVIREHTPVGRLAWRTGLYRVGVDSAIFIGPLVAGIVGPVGESVFLAFVGGAALALGARLLLAPGSGDPRAAVLCYRPHWRPDPGQGDAMKPLSIGDVTVSKVIELDRSATPVGFMLPTSTPERIAAQRDWLGPELVDPVTGEPQGHHPLLHRADALAHRRHRHLRRQRQAAQRRRALAHAQRALLEDLATAGVKPERRGPRGLHASARGPRRLEHAARGRTVGADLPQGRRTSSPATSSSSGSRKARRAGRSSA